MSKPRRLSHGIMMHLLLMKKILKTVIFFLTNCKSSQQVSQLVETHRKHSRSVLEGIGQAWHAGVVWEACVAVAWRQCGIEEGLLCGVMRLVLVLLRLS